MRKVGWILAIVVLLVTGVAGLANASGEMGSAATTLQGTVSFAVALYGVLGLVGGAGLARRRPWSVTICAAFAIAIAYAATVASFAYHDPSFSKSDTLMGTIAAFVSTALIGGFVVWVARYSTRTPAVATSAHAQ